MYILTCLKETVKIYLKKLRVSYYRVYFNGKIRDKNKLFNPCDLFFMVMFVTKKEKEVTDSLLSLRLASCNKVTQQIT